MGIQIGPIDIATRVILAPMSGVTDAPFRRLARRLGARLVVSEMIAMISATRHYEACAKALSAQDEMLGQAVNKLAQV